METACGESWPSSREAAGKVLGIRADYDALNMTEDTGLPFAATNGNMHACGHDAHAAILLGTAKLLTECRDELQGTIKLLFQPSEEDGKGAPAMIEDGVFENPAMDGIIGSTRGTSGRASCRRGGIPLRRPHGRRRLVHRHLRGQGRHGATPHLTVDPSPWPARRSTCSSSWSAVRRAPWIPPSLRWAPSRAAPCPTSSPDCTISGTIRSLSPETRKNLETRLKGICTDVAEALRGKASVSSGTGLPPHQRPRDDGENEGRHGRHPGDRGGTRGGRTHHGRRGHGLLPGKVPGSFFFLPANYGDERDYPHHHPKFNLNESVFWIGPAVMAKYALTWQ